MKPDQYTRRSLLRKAGYSLLPEKKIYRGKNGDTPVLIFPDAPTAERYCRHFRVAGKGEALWGHNGWYTDREFQDETYKPCIAIIGKVGLYGYLESVSGQVIFYLDGGKHDGTGPEDLNEFQRDLARWADDISQSLAEKESVYQEKWRAGRDIAEEIEDLQNRRTALYSEARDFIADLRRAAAGVCKDSAVWRHIVKLRKLAASLAATIADKTEQLKLYPEYE